MAFTLEILFQVDLARRTSEILATTTTDPQDPILSISTPLASGVSSNDNTLLTTIADKFSFEPMQAHLTISCLALAILYFIMFIASLVLVAAIILRSTFMLLIWMCAMTIMYLPEFGLVVYVSVYGWGIATRNGQTELVFFIIRAILNLLFIFRAHKLFKQWSYEKNFFRLKTGTKFTGYDSPYFIGDSLTTTINPVFSSSTLNLNRYDRVRDSNTNSPASNSVLSTNYHDIHHQQRNNNNNLRDNRARLSAASMNARELASKGFGGKFRTNYDFQQSSPSDLTDRGGFYLGDDDSYGRPLENARDHERRRAPSTNWMPKRPASSSLSINDDYAEYELDLDYRTLSHPNHQQQVRPQDRQQCANPGRGLAGQPDQSPDGQSYSTQSLDRRHMRDFTLTEQVILRPLGHQPFEYLHRPGSSSNLDSINNLSTQPSTCSSHSKLTKRFDLDLNHNRHYQF